MLIVLRQCCLYSVNAHRSLSTLPELNSGCCMICAVLVCCIGGTSLEKSVTMCYSWWSRSYSLASYTGSHSRHCTKRIKAALENIYYLWWQVWSSICTKVHCFISCSYPRHIALSRLSHAHDHPYLIWYDDLIWSDLIRSVIYNLIFSSPCILLFHQAVPSTLLRSLLTSISIAQHWLDPISIDQHQSTLTSSYLHWYWSDQLSSDILFDTIWFNLPRWTSGGGSQRYNHRLGEPLCPCDSTSWLKGLPTWRIGGSFHGRRSEMYDPNHTFHFCRFASWPISRTGAASYRMLPVPRRVVFVLQAECSHAAILGIFGWTQCCLQSLIRSGFWGGRQAWPSR